MKESRLLQPQPQPQADALAFLAKSVWVMGVLNATPDSFYGGSRTPQPEDAAARGAALAQDGADVVDIGGESTRPGAAPVPVSVELGRVLPVVRDLHARFPAL